MLQNPHALLIVILRVIIVHFFIKIDFLPCKDNCFFQYHKQKVGKINSLLAFSTHYIIPNRPNDFSMSSVLA